MRRPQTQKRKSDKGTSHSSGNAPVETVFVLTPFVSLLSVLAVFEVFRAANRMCGFDLYVLKFATIDDLSVTCSNGMTVSPTCRLEEVKGTGLAIVAASYEPPLESKRATLDVLRRICRRAKMLIAIDMGVFLLAEAGLIDDYEVSLNWETTQSFSERFPNIRQNTNMFTWDRGLLTCGGHTSGLDMALSYVIANHGKELGYAVAQELIYSNLRQSDSPQVPSGILDTTNQSTALKRAVSIMDDNIEYPIDVHNIARLAGISRRQLEYLTAKHFSLSPHQYYLRLRLSRGRSLLLHSDISISEIAYACGFGSPTAFSRAFRCEFDMTPSSYRTQFLSSYQRPVAGVGASILDASAGDMIRQARL